MSDGESRPLLEGDGESDKKGGSKGKKIFLNLGLSVILVAVGFIIGVLIGVYLLQGERLGPCLGTEVPDQIIEEADPSISRKLMDGIKPDNIRNNLQQLTVNPHMGGTPADEKTVADIVYSTWTAQGLDHVTNMTYDVLLSYPPPNGTRPNLIQILDGNDTVTYNSSTSEELLVQEMTFKDISQPWAAFTPPGTVQGELVYVNYGRIEDYRMLTETYNISLAGRIAIVRYGMIFRADKVKFAQRYGAVGVIIYSDPEGATDPNNRTNVFPDSWWLPPSGVQRGTYFPEKGDPLTPSYPATASAYRPPENETALLTIPAQPISYGDAINLLEKLGGAEVPAKWRGALDITYRFGPGFNQQTFPGWKVKLETHNSNQRRNTTDVMGLIRGRVEPDRYVILGNHRDAWTFGGVDPNSGTAIMLELSRVLMGLVKDGWRPKRSIIFCSWGTEEPGLVGSFEWVEEFLKVLGGRAVLHLNVDSAVSGDFFNHVDGVPLLYDAVYAAAKKVPTPNAAGQTLYDEWLAADPALDVNGDRTNLPRVGFPGAGSDHAPFIVEAGTSILVLGYESDPKLGLSSFPLYHTAYDLFRLVDQFIDPGFKHSRAVGQLWGELTRDFADSLLLPMNASTYARELLTYVQLLDRTSGGLMRSHGITLDQLYDAANAFIQSADAFHLRRDRINKKNPIEIRQYNDQLMQLERAFLDPLGLPGHPSYNKHVVFAYSLINSYSGNTFPGLTDLLFDIDQSKDPDAQWELVRRHLAAIIFAVNSATSVLQDVGKLSQ